MIAIQNQREWRRFCAEVLGNEGLADDPRLADNPARLENRAFLDAEIAKVFDVTARDAVCGLLESAKIAYGRVNEVADVLAHPALHRVPVDTAVGPVDVIAPPARIAGETQHFRPVPELGAHSDAIRAEFA